MFNKVEKRKHKIFILPYIDQQMDFWEKFSLSNGEYIKEIYFPIQDENIGTGRPRQPDKHLNEFLKSRILPVSLLINPVILARPVSEIAGSICDRIGFYLEHYNLKGVTLADLNLAQILKTKFPNLKLTASTLMEIYNEQQLVTLNNVFETIVPSNRIIRDITALKKLKKRFNGRIRIMVNESCLSSCVFRTQHFYEMSNVRILYPISLCNSLLEQHPWLRLTGGWILPQHLYMFRGLYDEIKLSGRVSLQKPENYMMVFESYLNEKELYPHEIGGGPASVNIPIDIESNFYKYTLTCKKNCTTCSVCSDYWKERNIIL